FAQFQPGARFEELPVRIDQRDERDRRIENAADHRRNTVETRVRRGIEQMEAMKLTQPFFFTHPDDPSLAILFLWICYWPGWRQLTSLPWLRKFLLSGTGLTRNYLIPGPPPGSPAARPCRTRRNCSRALRCGPGHF